MMRQPSSFAQLYRWHTRMMRGDAVETHDGDAHCGFYKQRMVKHGPWVPVRIFIERDIDMETGELASDEVMRMEVAGKPTRYPERRFTYLTAISRGEYETLMEAHRTLPVMAATHARISITDTPALPNRSHP